MSELTSTVVYTEAPGILPPFNQWAIGGGDFNDDGLTDVIVTLGSFPPAQPNAFAPRIFLRQADGGFHEATLMGTVEDFLHTRRYSTGDFNGDGHTDVLVAGHGYDAPPYPGEASTIFLNEGGGVFADMSSWLGDTPAFTHGVAVGDVNHDGRDDLVMGNVGGPLPSQLLIASPAGGFTASPLPFSFLTIAPWGVVLADLDNDGALDLVAGADHRGLALFRGRPGATGTVANPYFAEAQLLPVDDGAEAIAIDVRAVDINGDGRLDLVLSQTTPSYVTGDVRVLVQTAAGDFVDETAARIMPPPGLGPIHELLPVDLNGDGHVDLLASGAGLAKNSALINDGTGHFDPSGMRSGYPELTGGFLFSQSAGHVLDVNVRFDGVVTIAEITTLVGATGPGGADATSLGAPGFNEGFYLRQHPDVAAGVQNGAWASGLAHYLAVGREAKFDAFAPGTVVWGGAGIDLVSYTAGLSSHVVTSGPDASWSVQRPGSSDSDRMVNIERLAFTDTCIALDIDGNAGTVARLIGAVFGAASVDNQVFVGIGLSLLDGGMQPGDLAALAVATDAFAQLAGGHSNAQFVDRVYLNVVGMLPSDAERTLFVGMLDRGEQTQGSLALLASLTTLNAQQVDLVGLAASGLPYAPFG